MSYSACPFCTYTSTEFWPGQHSHLETRWSEPIRSAHCEVWICYRARSACSRGRVCQICQFVRCVCAIVFLFVWEKWGLVWNRLILDLLSTGSFLFPLLSPHVCILQSSPCEKIITFTTMWTNRNRTDRASAVTTWPLWFKYLRYLNHRVQVNKTEARWVRFRSVHIVDDVTLILSWRQLRRAVVFSPVFCPLLLSDMCSQTSGHSSTFVY